MGFHYFVVCAVMYCVVTCPAAEEFGRAVAGKNKHHVTIFSSKGGGGHVSAAKAITEYLNDMCVVTRYAFEDVLRELDLIRDCSLNSASSDSLYNYALANGCTRSASVFAKAGRSWFARQPKELVDELYKYLQTHPCDLVISVMPQINQALYEAAARLKIPCIVVALDIDLGNYLFALIDKSSSYKAFCLPFVLPPKLKKVSDISSAGRALTQSQAFGGLHVYTTGFPVRSDFLRLYDADILRKKLHIDGSKPVVVILMGAQGSATTLAYAQECLKSKKALEVIVICGRNRALLESVRSLKPPAHITYKALGFVDNIAEYFALTDIVIIKTGGATVAEAVASGLPMILDGISNRLDWEQMTADFVLESGFGVEVKAMSQLLPQLHSLLGAQGKKARELMRAYHKRSGRNPREMIRKVALEAIESVGKSEALDGGPQRAGMSE